MLKMWRENLATMLRKKTLVHTRLCPHRESRLEASRQPLHATWPDPGVCFSLIGTHAVVQAPDLGCDKFVCRHTIKVVQTPKVPVSDRKEDIYLATQLLLQMVRDEEHFLGQGWSDAQIKFMIRLASYRSEDPAV
jgi:hypothetical protein